LAQNTRSLIIGTTFVVGAALACPTPVHAYEGGIGAGNGGGTSRDVYLAKIKQKLDRLRIGSSTHEYEVGNWCSNVGGVLSSELDRAVTQIQRNQPATAQQILIDSLVIAGQSIEINGSFAAPMTKTLIDRGLMISQALDESIPANDLRYLQNKLNFLVNYVQFVIRTNRELDRVYYVPAHYRKTHCGRGGNGNGCIGDFDYAAYESRYILFAKEQLSFSSQKFLDQVCFGNECGPRPIGMSIAYLKITELLTAFASEDLSSSLFASRFSCQINELDKISSELRDFNAGDRSIWNSNRDALRDSAAGVDWVIRLLNEENCGYGRR
jgi:hypothetical protein